jgi:hypothetical protein
MALIAPKGSGKTTTIVNLLDFYKGYFHTILVFSPTVESDEKWDYAKQQVYLSENKPLKKWIKELEEKKKKQDGLVKRGVNTMELENMAGINKPFDGKIGEDCFFDSYTDDGFEQLLIEQKNLINLLKAHNQPKYMANRILIILDDLVGSALFSGTKGSFFKGFSTRHRHYSTSFLCVSQGYKEIPKTIRTNFTCLILFEIGSNKELEVVSSFLFFWITITSTRNTVFKNPHLLSIISLLFHSCPS